MKPLRSASTRDPPARCQAASTRSSAAARALGACERASMRSSVGQKRAMRTSSVEAEIAASRTWSSASFLCRLSTPSSRATRWIDCSFQRSSVAGKSLAGLLFQLTMRPDFGSISCGCLEGAR